MGDSNRRLIGDKEGLLQRSHILRVVGATMFKQQAEDCRRQAVHYAGRPEAPFLLNVARAFDELARSEPLASADVRRIRPSPADA